MYINMFFREKRILLPVSVPVAHQLARREHRGKLQHRTILFGAHGAPYRRWSRVAGGCCLFARPFRNRTGDVPTLQRGNVARTLQRPGCDGGPAHDGAHWPSRAWPAPTVRVGEKVFAPTISHLLSAIVLERPIPSIVYGKVHNRKGPDGAWPRSTLQPSLPGL